MTRRRGRPSPRSTLRLVVVTAAAGLIAVACSANAGAHPDPRPTTGTSTSPTNAAPDCSPARPASGTDAKGTLTFGGLNRSYVLAVPPRYDGRTAAPLILDFHGFLSNGPAQDLNTAMGSKGTARGFIVVTPTSVPPEWNEFGTPGRPDDFAFVRALVADLETRLCVDPRRVYAAGHSNGSAFVGFLVCKPPYLFAAAAMVSATIPSLCPDGIAPAVLAIAGTADPLVPYAGGSVGGSSIRIPAAPASVTTYAQHYHCRPTPSEDHPIPGINRLQYTGCVAASSVVFDTVVDGTHDWPGSASARANPSDSVAGQTFDATSEILEFVSHHQHAP